jgi:TPR repeat protein
MKPTVMALSRSIVIAALFAVGCDRSQVPGIAASAKKPSAVESIRKAAGAGELKAQLELARRLDAGDGVTKDLGESFVWFLKSAEAGDATAMVEVAKRLQNGKGVRKNYDNSKPWLQKAAERGNAEGQYRYAKTFGYAGRRGAQIFGDKNELQRNADSYVLWMSKAITQNYPPAAYELGMTFLSGGTEAFASKGAKYLIQPDKDKGLSLLRNAADGGHWEAELAMGVLYQLGFGAIKEDKVESAKYWSKLTQHSESETQRFIGDFYNESFKTLYSIGKNKYQGRLLSFDETNKVAIDWYEKAAGQNDARALTRLAEMHRDGRGVWKNDQKAIELFKRAAELGDYDAQRELAFAYLEGRNVVKDYAEAYKWLLQAAEEDEPWKWSDVHKTRNALGVLHENGWGAEKDLVAAYAWYNIAAAGGYEKAKQNLARVEGGLAPEQLREAQMLSREWAPGKPMVTNSTNKSSSPTKTRSSVLNLASMGTGFYISRDGYVLTNHHVVERCDEIRVPAESAVGKSVVADQANDLAILKLDVIDRAAVIFSASDDLRQGDEVFVFGFPLGGYLPAAGNVTLGIVSALAGPGNNSSLLQMTAPVQPGNSGGPLYNKKGRVVGVVVGKADAIKIAKVTGDIPQNINFAITSRTVKSFLEGNKIEYQKKGDTFAFSKDSVAIADTARKSTVKVECWR